MDKKKQSQTHNTFRTDYSHYGRAGKPRPYDEILLLGKYLFTITYYLRRGCPVRHKPYKSAEN